MALVLHLGGVGECVRLIWEWSVHNQESGGSTLSASSVDHEFHPYVQIEQRRVQEGARHSTAPNSVCNLQGRIHHEGL
jgi:hypothetical protein